jgi:hypothetical protein
MTVHISCYEPHVDKACDVFKYRMRGVEGVREGMYFLTKEYGKRFKMKNNILNIFLILHDII